MGMAFGLVDANSGEYLSVNQDAYVIRALSIL